MEPTFSNVLFILLVLAVINYLALVAMQRMKPQFVVDSEQQEGFTDVQQKETYLNSDELYDSFYASVYDQLTQSQRITEQKVMMIVTEWKKTGALMEHVEVVDAGCGTGVACISLAKMNMKSVLGIDKSKAMIERAQTFTLDQSKLTAEQKSLITFREGDLLNPSVIGGGAVTHAICLYFTIYYLPDKEAFFRNMFLWVKPGGELVVEVVNKYKFDPMLDSASPWIGFSLQKYSKERVTESKVTFDKFEYAAKFDLQDPGAEFRETFRFKDGKVRRQRHRFVMPPIDEIAKMAQVAGWTYTKFLDLTLIGFEYSYLLFFRHP